MPEKIGGLTAHSTLTLNDGGAIPMLGFGVFQIASGDACENAVSEALAAGYRHIDTAWIYRNEASVGKAIARSGIPRKDLYLTTKTPFDLSPEKIRAEFAQSLEKLQTDYVDLYLIHWPMADPPLQGAWETLQALKADGRCRSIGVSNFTIRRFEEAFLKPGVPIPAVNQFEAHVFNFDTKLVDYCRAKGMVVEAYSPLARGQKMAHPVLDKIAAAHGKSNAQVMIRFLLQKSVVVLPKSVTPSRIRENINVFDFELTDEQMRALEGLNEGLVIQDWRPQNYY
mgnify:CR=1 FL=1